jgi:tetratricopeptide (TPR) repeat protein
MRRPWLAAARLGRWRPWLAEARLGRRRVAVTVLLLAAGGALTPCFAQATDDRAGRILVMPFENVKRDGAIFWLGEASSVLLADNLNAAGLNAITRPERQQAFERLQVPASAVLTDATVIRIAQLVGAAEVVVGSLQRDADGLVVRVRSFALDAGRVRADVTERGPIPDLFAIFDRIALRLAPPPPRSSEGVTGTDRPPIAAFENFIKGLLAETPGTAIKYLQTALTSFPRYDRARLALWDVYAAQGDHQLALTAVQAVPPVSRWSRRARFLAGISQLNLKKLDDAFGTYKTLADQEPTPTVLNNLGIVQLRRGGNPQSGVPTYYFDRAAQADPDDPDYFFNLGYAYWVARDYPAAMYWLREAVRRSPADGDAHFVLGAALAASGRAAESMREKELARRLSSTYEEWEKRPAAEQVPRGLERVKNNEVELPHARRIDTKITETAQRDQQELATFYVDRARRLFQQESDREAVAELDRALYLSPYLADAHLLLGRIHLRNGRVREAVDALKISLWSAETAEAHTVLAEAYVQTKEVAAARAEAARALTLDPSSSDAKRLLDMLKSP